MLHNLGLCRPSKKATGIGVMPVERHPSSISKKTSMFATRLKLLNLIWLPTILVEFCPEICTKIKNDFTHKDYSWSKQSTKFHSKTPDSRRRCRCWRDKNSEQVG